jgi:hypothetical protein
VRLDEWQKYLAEQFVEPHQQVEQTDATVVDEPVLTEITGYEPPTAPTTLSQAIVTEATLPMAEPNDAGAQMDAESGKRTNRRQSLSLYPIITSDTSPSDSLPNAGISTRSIKPMRFTDDIEMDIDIPEFGAFVTRKSSDPVVPPIPSDESVSPDVKPARSRFKPTPRKIQPAPGRLEAPCPPPGHWFALQEMTSPVATSDPLVPLPAEARRIRTAQRLLDPFITLEDAAALLELSEVQLQRLGSQGQIKISKTRRPLTNSRESSITTAPAPARKRVLLSEVMRYRREKQMQLGFAADLEFSEPGV